MCLPIPLQSTTRIKGRFLYSQQTHKKTSRQQQCARLHTRQELDHPPAGYVSLFILRNPVSPLPIGRCHRRRVVRDDAAVSLILPLDFSRQAPTEAARCLSEKWLAQSFTSSRAERKGSSWWRSSPRPGAARAAVWPRNTRLSQGGRLRSSSSRCGCSWRLVVSRHMLHPAIGSVLLCSRLQSIPAGIAAMRVAAAAAAAAAHQHNSMYPRTLKARVRATLFCRNFLPWLDLKMYLPTSSFFRFMSTIAAMP